MATMGEKIRDARVQRGLTQADLAEDLVTASMISQIEADKTKPSYPLLSAIANRLSLPAEFFLSELEDQFTLNAHLNLAAYYLLTNQPALAEQTLSSIEAPTPPGLQYQEYHLLLAKSHRLRNQTNEAILLLEDLREQAFRVQERRLLFKVCNESAHVEYAIGNLDGAMHEWRKALELGEVLSSQVEYNTSEFRWELAEVAMGLHHTCIRKGEAQRAEEFLRRAAELAESSGRFLDVARGLASDGTAALATGDSNRAKNSVEKAVTVLQTARLVGQHMVIHNKLNTELREAMEPWQQAAIATATADPGSFIAAELTRIESCLVHRDASNALRRIDRCFDIMNDYKTDVPLSSEWVNEYTQQLLIFKARAYRASGDTEQATVMLEQLAKSYAASGSTECVMQVLSHLMKCHQELGNPDRVLELAEELEQLAHAYESRAIQLG